ncbi:ATPase RavA stimulator ViaA, partial [Vibrio cholerae]
TSVRRRMTKVCETERFQRVLALYQEVIHWDEETFFTQVPDVVKILEWDSAFYLEARRLLEKEMLHHNPMFPHFFCDQWYYS